MIWYFDLMVEHFCTNFTTWKSVYKHLCYLILHSYVIFDHLGMWYVWVSYWVMPLAKSTKKVNVLILYNFVWWTLTSFLNSLITQNTAVFFYLSHVTPSNYATKIPSLSSSFFIQSFIKPISKKCRFRIHRMNSFKYNKGVLSIMKYRKYLTRAQRWAHREIHLTAWKCFVLCKENPYETDLIFI